MFKSKLKAASLHGLVTLFTAAITASLVFLVWYKGPFAKMLSGTDLYVLVLGVELCLGPLMSLVIYNPNKTRAELVRDYSIIGLVQLAALIYGLYSVALSRPVYVVFVKDRIEVIVATELKAEDLAAATDKAFKTLPWFGFRNICTESPSDAKEKSELLWSGLSGKDIQLFPKYYRDCRDGEVINKARSKWELFSVTGIKAENLPPEIKDVDFKWLPVVTRFNNWLVVYINGDINNPMYVNLNPF